MVVDRTFHFNRLKGNERVYSDSVYYLLLSRLPNWPPGTKIIEKLSSVFSVHNVRPLFLLDVQLKRLELIFSTVLNYYCTVGIDFFLVIDKEFCNSAIFWIFISTISVEKEEDTVEGRFAYNSKSSTVPVIIPKPQGGVIQVMNLIRSIYAWLYATKY